MTTYKNYIDGQWRSSASGKVFADVNPADQNEVIGYFQQSTAGDVIEAGIPPGVLNFVTGSGSEIGDEMVVNPSVKAVSFTGSTEIGLRINRIASQNMTRTQLEMGGKNPTVVLDDADLELAADGVAFAAYSCSGQWCTSTSRVILMDKIANRFVDILVGKVKKIRVGNGLDPDVSMGPLAGESPRRRYSAPYFRVIRVQSFEEALEVANNVKQGLSSSVYTGNISKALRFMEESEVGLTHLNLPTSYKEVQLPFSGIKTSGFGLPEAGYTGIEFFTENKSVYINYE